jgi:hypothetical protein
MRVRVVGRELIKRRLRFCEFTVEVDTHNRGWLVLRTSRDIVEIKDYLIEHHREDEIEYIVKQRTFIDLNISLRQS